MSGVSATALLIQLHVVLDYNLMYSFPEFPFQMFLMTIKLMAVLRDILPELKFSDQAVVLTQSPDLFFNLHRSLVTLRYVT
jgi:hypothetical protein